MKRRILSILLVLALLVSALPFQVSAAQEMLPRLEPDDITATGTNSFGNMLAEKIQANQAESDGSSYIQSIEISNSTATVSAELNADCTLVVGIYSEDGQELHTSAKADLQAGAQQTKLTFEKALPEYFLVKGFLIDSDTYAPLCNEYVTPMYTQEMQALADMTTDDFDENRVLNLDEAQDNNFAVYADSTIIIEPAEGRNTVTAADESTGFYIFDNIDDQISGLKVGDAFAYEYEPGNVLIVKIKDIAIQGTTATIEAADAEMDDVFDYVKIDTSDTLENAVIDNSNLEDGVTYDGLEETDPDTRAIDDTLERGVAVKYNLDKKFGSENNYVKLSGSFGFSAKVTLKYYLSLRYSTFEFNLKYSTALEAKISAQLDLVEIPLGSIDFSPVPGVYIGMTPKLVLEVSAELALKVDYNAALGCKATFGIGIKDSIENTSTHPTTDCDLTIEGKVFFGVDFEPHVKVISDAIAKASMDATVGLEITGTRKLGGEDDLENHLCDACVDGEISFKMKLTAGVELLKHFEIKATLAEFTRKLADFYWSLTYDEFGWGECPHVGTGGSGAWEDGSHGARTDSGTCGEQVNWELFEDGTLHIYGSGAIEDYNYYNYRSEVP